MIDVYYKSDQYFINVYKNDRRYLLQKCSILIIINVFLNDRFLLQKLQKQ